MSYTVVLSLDLDSPLTDFDLKWEEYSYKLKLVLDNKLIYRSKSIPLGENGHVDFPMDFANQETAIDTMHRYDFYIDVYWKNRRIATEIRLREPQEYRWYNPMTPDYNLKAGHREAGYKADAEKFVKVARGDSKPKNDTKSVTAQKSESNSTKVPAKVTLPATTGNNEKEPEHTVQEEIDKAKPAGTLIERAKASKGFTSIPSDFWILGERATINRPNQFDDVIHLMKGEKLILSVNGTTHPGEPALLMKAKAKVPVAGAPVWDYGWHYSVWGQGLHRKKIKAFVQVGTARVLRDSDKDSVPGNSGSPHDERGRGLNFHPASYTGGTASTIGTWSTGCVVVKSAHDYYLIYNQIVDSGQRRLSFCVILGNVNGVSK